MTKKQKKIVQEITNGLSKQCQITTKPIKKPPSGNTILADQISPELLAKWPKLKIRVPPIFIHKPIDFVQHVKKLIQLGIKFYKPHLTQAYTRVICQTFNDHKSFIQYLDKKQLPYHTFGNPLKRKMKVVIRGLPNNTDLNLIKAELKSVQIPIIRVHKMNTGGERKDNTMLLLAVVPYDDDGKVILKVTQIMGHKVTLEPPKEKQKQCYRCQKWGHSQRYCHGKIKCVKCAGEHLTKKCDKKPDIEPKCANCGETHTANYKKCSYARRCDLIKMMVDLKIIRPRNKEKEVVTTENCHYLYENVDYED